MVLVTILYEDSVGAHLKEFGPHNLVVQCVADKLGGDVWRLHRQLIPEPKNGVNKLLDALRKDMNKLARGDSRVFALIDADDVRERLQLPQTACRTLVVAQIKRCPSADRLDVVLLEKNLESLLVALRELQPTLATAEDWNRALAHKKHNERDLILNRIAKNPAHGALRVELLRTVPSFDRLVTRVAKLLA